MLYRAVACDSVYNNHVERRLWFRLPDYFRNVQGIDQNKLERIGSYYEGETNHFDISDERALQPAYILSFSENPESKEQFGSICTKLQGSVEFMYVSSIRCLNPLPQQSITEWNTIKRRVFEMSCPSVNNGSFVRVLI